MKARSWLLFDPDAATDSKWTVSGFDFPNPMAVGSLEPEIRNYPHIRMTPLGLFYQGNDKQVLPDDAFPQSSRFWWPADQWAVSSPLIRAQQKNHNRQRSSLAVLTLDPREDAVTVLLVGGGAQGAVASDSEAITYYLDPEFGSQVQQTSWVGIDMVSTLGRRDMANAVLLPDGSVLAVGGQVDPATQNTTTERFTPTAQVPPAGTWQTMAAFDGHRAHHAFSLLLPDGRVFVTGHQNPGVERKDYQIFYPPYLFTSSGWATRDTIAAAPDTVHYGLPFEITILDGAGADVDEVCLMRPSAVTHGADFSQTRILLPHATVPGDSSRLVVSGPVDATYAPEGWYMLFVLDGGVPSEARWIKVERGTRAVASGQTAYWALDVYLDRDFEVQSGGTLVVLPGTTVHAAAGPVSTPNLGDSSSRVEIVVKGRILADGTSALPIVFQADGTSPAADAWGGLEFDLPGIYVATYGTMGALEPLSSISHATIRDAEIGVQIVDFIAPGLDSVTFQNITPPGSPNLDILLDETDVFIPYGTWILDGEPEPEEFVVPPSARWSLLGGTNVVATNTVATAANTPIGDSTQVNLVVQGAMFTTGSAAAGDQVTFRPQVRNNSTGDDWGGLWIESNYKSDIDYADIGHAANPVIFFYPDSSTGLRHSRVHHFADLGVWVYKSKAGGGLLKLNLVERGTGLDLGLGNAGIFLDQADQMTLIGNTIDLTASDVLEVAGNHYGLEIYMGKIFCQNPAPQARTVTIDSTTVLGNSQDDTGNRSGIFCNWICGSSSRTVSVTESTIQDWNHSGLRFYQCGDIDVSCNRVEASKRAVHFSRNTEATGTSVRFKTNRFEGEASNRHAVVQTDNALKIDLGPSGLAKGDNRLYGLNAVGPTPALYWMYEDDAVDANELKAQNNSWWIDGALETSGADSLLATEFPSTGQVNVNKSGYYTTDASNGCPPCVPGCGQQAGAHAALQEAEAPSGEGQAAAQAGLSIPERSSLGAPWPNPSARSVTLGFGVGRANGGPHRLIVYDVAGRRVRTVVEADLAPGIYRQSWDGRDEHGRVVSSGVYFVRLTGPAIVATRKILLRE